MAKFPKQRQGYQSDISKSDCNAVMGNLLNDIKSLALESDTGRKSLANNFAHSDLGLLPTYVTMGGAQTF